MVLGAMDVARLNPTNLAREIPHALSNWFEALQLALVTNFRGRNEVRFVTTSTRPGLHTALGMGMNLGEGKIRARLKRATTYGWNIYIANYKIANQ